MFEAKIQNTGYLFHLYIYVFIFKPNICGLILKIPSKGENDFRTTTYCNCHKSQKVQAGSFYNNVRSWIYMGMKVLCYHF